MKHWVTAIMEEVTWGNAHLSDHVREGLARIEKTIKLLDVHQFRTDEFEEIADELAECADMDELNRLVWKAATSAGFQHFAILVLKQGNTKVFKKRVATSFETNWIDHYEKMSYRFIDPVITRAEKQDGIFLFSDLDETSPMAEKFWRDSKGFRTGVNGLCIANTHHDGSRLAVSFHTMSDAEKTKEIVRLNGHDLEILSRLAIECFCYISRGEIAAVNPLDHVELRFLHKLATGSPLDDVKEISARYGSNIALQDSIRRKLGVSTIFQAISVASSMRWFDEMPFSLSDTFPMLSPLAGWDIDKPSKLSGTNSC